MTGHGTLPCYYAGCRCTECAAAKRERVRLNRQKLRDDGYARATHGSASAYDAGCRCIACRRYRSRKSVAESYRRRGGRGQGPYGVCPQCEGMFALLAGGFLICHGPIGDRCSGSHCRPLRQEEAA